jgi:hypothetical protein
MAVYMGLNDFKISGEKDVEVALVDLMFSVRICCSSKYYDIQVENNNIRKIR